MPRERARERERDRERESERAREREREIICRSQKERSLLFLLQQENWCTERRIATLCDQGGRWQQACWTLSVTCTCYASLPACCARIPRFCRCSRLPWTRLSKFTTTDQKWLARIHKGPQHHAWQGHTFQLKTSSKCLVGMNSHLTDVHQIPYKVM